jgi:hypothetical protein
MIKKKQHTNQSIKLFTLSWIEILMVVIFALVFINGAYNLYVK